MADGWVGVDFGTATTLVAAQSPVGGVAVLPLGHATAWLPSVAALAGADVIVGEAAEDVATGQLRSVKRAITERREQLTVTGPDGPREVAADEVIAAILREVCQRAERVGLPLTSRRSVRLGCPAMWDGDQRRRLIDVATSVGLDLDDSALIDEPVGAGLAWLGHRFLAHGERPAGRLLVFDMGGGTVDAAVAQIEGGPSPRVRVLASVGAQLAGDALDSEIARDLADEMAEHRIDIAWHPQPELAWALLERAGRQAKVRLSQVTEHPVVLPPALAYPQVIRYRRDQLDLAFASMLDAAESLIIAALRAARMADGEVSTRQVRGVDRADLIRDVDVVLLVGGMSRVPSLRRRLGELFVHAQISDDVGVPADQAVVAGLAQADGYERIELPRPACDFVLDLPGGAQRTVLYPAHTPLYQSWQVYNGYSSLGYERRLAAAVLPAGGVGLVRAVAPGGSAVPLLVDGVAQDGLPVRGGPGELVFEISCDTHLRLTDGAGHTRSYRLDGWPAMRPGQSLRLRQVR
ncbi:MAG TPA: Hsp70 family protein [Micromonosporaceae bacterium]